MTAAADSSQDSQNQVLEELRTLKGDVSDFREEVSEYKDEVRAFNQKFETYQKATQWVVQLAFSLIAAATVTVIISTVTGR
ncbi:hypothetical protein IQ260_07550 [Leptolyngbya cf. ectocarpi LEGE 11479]|uniref:Uncharacterized protein n=1 Tax=Leptolyngbya cf. ectocarpi LEGE 11479 TaxID=1828722 RepID=A0A928ZQR0_LEPEC|nr:hypothetical protein [Leptolyngbya ectocarpi]MBE9066505.1 hypothetical protein [Leptolyngbya cf. ectocarpi LEGE 11479]